MSPLETLDTRGGNSGVLSNSSKLSIKQKVRAVGGGGGLGNPGITKSDGIWWFWWWWWNEPGEPVYGSGNTPTDPNHPQVQGNEVVVITYYGSGGGGGGGGVGGPGAPDNSLAGYGSHGWHGLQCLIAGPPSAPQPGAPGPGGGTGWFAGGGGGGGTYRCHAGGYGGGGTSSPRTTLVVLVEVHI